jgi:hypothetical protein
MLTLSRAGSPITCKLEQCEQAEPKCSVQRLTRSLRVTAGDTGFAGLVGAGYELRLGRRFHLNPVVDLVSQRYDARAGGSYRERLVNFGLGVLVQSGR